MTKHTRIPIIELRAALRYEPDTGLLFRVKDGRPALFTLKATGYLWGHISRKLILAHRAAWAITHGEWVDQIDHINRIKTDNRLLNLRSVTPLENAMNKTNRRGDQPDLKGVAYYAAKDRWLSRFSGHYLGCFRDAETAARAYDKAARIGGLSGDFLNFPNEP